MKLANTREARDSFFLIGVVLLTVLPHFPRLPIWASGIVLALLAWRAWLAQRALPLPSRWLLIAILLAVVGMTKLAHGVVLGRTAGLTLVCILVAMKLLEMHARRDAFVVFFLGFFLVLTQYLHSQALWVAVWTFVAVWGLLTSLVLAQMPLGQPLLRVAVREAARSTLLGLPLMLMLFLLFPRIGPLWGLPGQSGKTGLSNEMFFGAMAELALDESVAMRLRALPGSKLPPSAQLYIRGPVLSRFDGQAWHAEPSLWADEPLLTLVGSVIRYEAMTEPQSLPLLPLLEMAPGQPGETWNPTPELLLRRNADLNWVFRPAFGRAPPIGQRLRFEQVAVTDPGAVQFGPLNWHGSLRPLLQQPANLNPRLQAWVRDLSADLPPAADGPQRAQQLSQRLLTHIRRQPFSYTLQPGIYGETTPHAVDEFWFDRRQGFCEHYATAYVMAMRAGGVPARVVTGYLGADPQTSDGWTVIRNSNAHAWAEFWAPELGWRRVDPTGAVAPERVESSRLLSANPGVFRGAVDAIDPTLWRRLRQFNELVDLRWQQWVLGYQQQQQFKLLESLGVANPDWTALGRVIAATIASLAIAGFVWQRWQARARSPWPARMSRVHQKLLAQGLPVQPHEAPLRWAQSTPAGPLREHLLELESMRYGAQALDGAASRWRAWRMWSQWWRRFAQLVGAHER